MLTTFFIREESVIGFKIFGDLEQYSHSQTGRIIIYTKTHEITIYEIDCERDLFMQLKKQFLGMLEKNDNQRC